jgi:quercetin dioxygenase-like cupin family protein
MGAYFPSGALDLMCRSNLPDWLLFTRVRGDSDLYITQNTIQPGGQSGWHTHPGPSLVTVTEGAVTVYEDDCTSATYSLGQTFTDLGCGDVHNVVNETAAEAKTIAVQIVPHGAPRREDKRTQVAHKCLLAPESKKARSGNLHTEILTVMGLRKDASY